jgi:hypothetical protein
MHSTSSLLLFLPFFERPTDLMKWQCSGQDNVE